MKPSPRIFRAASAALLLTTYALAHAQAPSNAPAPAKPPVTQTARAVPARISETAPSAHLTIDTKDIVSPVSPMLYGLMTEEINHSYDGGLYAEMVQNRTFRGSWSGIDHWALVRLGNAQASMEIEKTGGPSPALPTSLKVTIASASAGNSAGFSNQGYWGIPAKPKTEYKGSFYAATENASAVLEVKLLSDRTGGVLAEANVPLHAGPWSLYHYSLKTNVASTSMQNHVEFTLAQPGIYRFQLMSLMGPTFHDRPNGNRADLMEKMAGLHPQFLRLPGGNYLEGDRLEDWYNWKQTIGPLVDRPGHQAPWTYWSTDGLGLLEFLEWCEDLKVEPVLAVYAGYALHGDRIKPGRDLEPFVQSALDEVEYVTGDKTTKWGAERGKDGHPEPFPLHYIEIGNEDWFDKTGSYDARFGQFARALHTKYPQYKLITTAPVKEKEAIEQPDVLDDHYYKPVSDMLDFVHHYDNAPRTGPKIFVGEWATLSGSPTPDFGGALADAAWMTGMERNSDLIVMASYAPLLANVNPTGSQWGTNLIGFNAEASYGSPSYYAQALFAGHLGDGTPRSTLTGGGERFYYSATVDSTNHVLHLKLVNANSHPQALSIELQGLSGNHAAKIFSLHAASYEATNSIGDPNFIHPMESSEAVRAPSWTHTSPGLSIQVIDIPLQ